MGLNVNWTIFHGNMDVTQLDPRLKNKHVQFSIIIVLPFCNLTSNPNLQLFYNQRTVASCI